MLADTDLLSPHYSPRRADDLDSWRQLQPNERERYARSRADRKLEAAGLPHGVAADARWDFAAWPRKAVDEATAWATQPKLPTLVLSGPVGVGKTSLACLLASLVARRTDVRTLRYVQSGALMQAMGNADAPADLRNAGLLIVDDLGRGHEGAFPSARSRLWCLLDHRWSNGLPVLYTTNLVGTPAELARLFGAETEPLLSRLSDRRNWHIELGAAGGDQRAVDPSVRGRR